MYSQALEEDGVEGLKRKNKEEGLCAKGSYRHILVNTNGGVDGGTLAPGDVGCVI